MIIHSFVLNNNGYTVERLIHGKDAFYNTLPLWDYDGLRKVFGPSHPSKYHGPITTGEQLDKLIADPEFNACESLQVRSVQLMSIRVTATDILRSLLSLCWESWMLRCLCVRPPRPLRPSTRSMLLEGRWVGNVDVFSSGLLISTNDRVQGNVVLLATSPSSNPSLSHRL